MARHDFDVVTGPVTPPHRSRRPERGEKLNAKVLTPQRTPRGVAEMVQLHGPSGLFQMILIVAPT